jgi:hypothetical protein
VGEGLHDPVDLQRLAWKSEAPQELAQRADERALPEVESERIFAKNGLVGGTVVAETLTELDWV